MLKKATGDYRTLIVILFCTGQRRVDGVKLEWKSVDFERNIITLIPQKTAKRTGTAVYIPLLPMLRQELMERKQTGRYVLPELVEQYDRDSSSVSKKIKAIFEAAGIQTEKEMDSETARAVVDVGAHSLRHTFVSVARMAGLPNPFIYQITGHSSQEMMDHYTQFSEEMVATLAGNLLGGGKQKALPFTEMVKEPLPLWADEKMTELMGLTDKITGKKNGLVAEAMRKILEQLIP